MKVHADRSVCIGAGMCVTSTDEVFDQDDDGVVAIVTEDVPAAEEQRVRDAVRLCPSGAITVSE